MNRYVVFGMALPVIAIAGMTRVPQPVGARSVGGPLAGYPPIAAPPGEGDALSPNRFDLRLLHEARVGDPNGAKTSVLIQKAPAYSGSEDSIATAFDGDFSKVPSVVQTIVTGNATLGTPKSGYKYSPGATGTAYSYFFNGSGWNEQTDGNDGRTGATVYRTRLYQHGQGDVAAYNCSGFVDGQRRGATSFLAQPAISCVNGDFTAGADGTYLNPGEFILDDAGHDAAAFGWVVNLKRTNADGHQGTTWGGFRSQSIGTQPIDGMFSVAGPARIGLDLVGGTYTARDRSKGSAIAMKANDRVYGNATNNQSSRFSSTVALGGSFFDYSVESGWNFVSEAPAGMTVNGVPVMRFGTPQSPTAPCAKGETRFDAKYLYTCYSANSWHRIPVDSGW